MRNYKIITVIICFLVSAAMSGAGGYSINAVAESVKKGQTDSSCSDELRQSMEAMHHRMMAVEISGDADGDFVRLMLPHHEAAVEMAKIELKCGKDAVNQRLAQEIVVEQQSEIDLMNLWLAKRSAQIIPNHTEHLNEEKKP